MDAERIPLARHEMSKNSAAAQSPALRPSSSRSPVVSGGASLSLDLASGSAAAVTSGSFQAAATAAVADAGSGPGAGVPPVEPSGAYVAMGSSLVGDSSSSSSAAALGAGASASSSAAVTCDEEIEFMGPGRFHAHSVVICGLGNAADAVELLCVSYIIPELEEKVSDFEQGVLQSSVFVGMLIGGLVAGFAADRWGRKPSFLFSLGINAVFGFLSAFSPDWTVLALCRIISGIGVGGSIPTVFTIYTEYLPQLHRGWYLSIVAWFWMIGTIFTAAIAWILLGQFGVSWRVFAAVCALPALSAFLLTFFLLPESPRYLYFHGHLERARDALVYLGRWNRTPSRLERGAVLLPPGSTSNTSSDGAVGASETERLLHRKPEIELEPSSPRSKAHAAASRLSGTALRYEGDESTFVGDDAATAHPPRADHADLRTSRGPLASTDAGLSSSSSSSSSSSPLSSSSPVGSPSRDSTSESKSKPLSSSKKTKTKTKTKTQAGAASVVPGARSAAAGAPTNQRTSTALHDVALTDSDDELTRGELARRFAEELTSSGADDDDDNDDDDDAENSDDERNGAVPTHALGDDDAGVLYTRAPIGTPSALSALGGSAGSWAGRSSRLSSSSPSRALLSSAPLGLSPTIVLPMGAAGSSSGAGTPSACAARCAESMAGMQQTLRDFFHPALRRTSVLLMVVWFSLSFGWYGLILWIPTLFKEQEFELDAYQDAFLVAAANLPGNLLASYLMDKMGRKRLLGYSMLLSTLFGVLFAFSPNAAMTVTTASLLNAVSVGGWNSLDCLSTESFPTSLRTTAMGLLAACGRLGSIVGQFAFGALIHVSVTALLLTAAAMLFVGAVAGLLLPQETSGRQLADSVHAEVEALSASPKERADRYRPPADA